MIRRKISRSSMAAIMEARANLNTKVANTLSNEQKISHGQTANSRLSCSDETVRDAAHKNVEIQ